MAGIFRRSWLPRPSHELHPTQSWIPTAPAAASQSVEPGLIDQTGVTFAPEVARRIITEVGRYGFQVTEEGLRVFGPLTETGQWVLAFNPGTGVLTVTPALIDQTGVTFALQANQQIAVGLITQTGSTFAPQVNQSVAPGLISSTGTTFAPQVNQQITVGLITQTGATFAPTQVQQQVTPGLIDQTAQAFAPALGSVLQVPLITSTGTTFAPSQVQQQVVVGLIDQTGQVFTPALGTFLQIPLISNIGVLFDPTVKQQVLVPLITSAGIIFAPTLEQAQPPVNPPLIVQTGSSFTPEIFAIALAGPVKGPTRTTPVAGNDNDTEPLTRPTRAVLIGTGANSLEDV